MTPEEFLAKHPEFADALSCAIITYDNHAYREIPSEEFNKTLSLLRDFHDIIEG